MSRRPVGRWAAVVLSSVVLVACGAAGSGAKPSGGQAAAPARPAPPRVAAASSASPSAGSTGAASSAPSHLTRLNISIVVMDPAYAGFLMALGRGYYKQAGLDVHLDVMGGGLATPALVSGQIGVDTSAGSAMNSILRGFPLKEIYTEINHPVYWLVAKPGITSVTQLKGKRVGIFTHGDTTELSTDFYLQQHGMSGSDVVTVPLGFSPVAILAALNNGAVSASVVAPTEMNDPALQAELKSGRLHILADFRNIVMQYNGAATSDAMIAGHRAELVRFLEATMRGLRYAADPAHEQAVVQTIHRMAPNSAPVARLTADYRSYRSYFDLTGLMTPAEETRNIQLLASYEHVPAPARSKVYDDSIAKAAYARLTGS